MSRSRSDRLAVFERRTLFGSLIVAMPAGTAVLAAWALGPMHRTSYWILVALVTVSTLGLAYWQQRRVMYPIYTLTGLLEALREGDYSLRGAAGVLGHAIHDVNALAERLQRERIHFEESSHLLTKTLAALDSAVMVFDGDAKLRLLNTAARGLLRADQQQSFGRLAAELGVESLLQVQSGAIVAFEFPGRSGRFEVRHAPFRSDGREGRILVVHDISRLLREEERLAWQRLLRVLGHEINNSLAPIASIAEAMASVLAREELPGDWREDLREGLGIIGNRASSLSRFLAGYAQLTRLPPPQRESVELDDVCGKVARLEQRLRVEFQAGGPLRVMADPDQLEQALINLVRNAVDAVLSSDAPGGGVRMSWSVSDARVLIDIDDEGPGPPSTGSLFVPYFTTKPGGTGIGLTLVRAIADAHDGGISLESRPGGRGARARLWLPA